MPGADGVYNQSEDPGSEGATLASTDDSYASRSGQSQIPVQKDNVPVEDPIDAATADSDETLSMSFAFGLYTRTNKRQSEMMLKPLTKAIS